MSDLVLGPLFTRPLHPADWQRPPGSDDFRVTNPFAGVDLVNGGRHNAVDVGNARTGYPVLAPASRPARGLWHFDGALGAEWDLGNGWRLEAWHLGVTLPVGPRPAAGTARGAWRDIRRGEQIGLTGSSGLGTGAHTHLALFGPDGLPRDPEPHLFGSPIQGAIDDMARFNDVAEGDRFAASIERLARAGIVTGDPAGNYRPADPVTRGEMAAMLDRLVRAAALALPDKE